VSGSLPASNHSPRRIARRPNGGPKVQGARRRARLLARAYDDGTQSDPRSPRKVVELLERGGSIQRPQRECRFCYGPRAGPRPPASSLAVVLSSHRALGRCSLANSPAGFALDLLLVSMSWVAPLAWMVAQIVALGALRGVPRLLSALPLAAMAGVVAMTYSAHRANSNLWPLLYLFASTAALGWVAMCLVFGRPRFSKKLIWSTLSAAAAFVIAMSVVSARRTESAAEAKARQSAQADALLDEIGPRVHVGKVEPRGQDPFNRQNVQDVLDVQDVELSLCYEDALRLQPATAARAIVLDLRVGRDGRVVSAAIQPPIALANFERCILNALQRVRFAPGSTTETTAWSVPLRLEPRPELDRDLR
jgi:hypothetical protein